MTQQEILDRLNQLTLRYNLTWRDVKYDADKAIIKINNFLGTMYPKMSVVLTHAQATYTFRSDAIEIPYFPEQYIHTVVIPYIATEILARDEEFTTIYNKYLMEVDEGLFQMFQNEFNRVPLAYRQQPDQGVFFGRDTALADLDHNQVVSLPVHKFKIHYYINNNAVVMTPGTEWIDTSEAVLYGETQTVRGFEGTLVDIAGLYYYTFSGWTKDIAATQTATVDIDSVLTLITDVHLYAVWNKQPVFSITNSVISVRSETPDHILTRIVLPNMYEGRQILSISSYFLANQENVNEIYLPSSLTTIQQNAFNGYLGETVVIHPQPLANTVVSIGIYAFTNIPNMTAIVIPGHVTTIVNEAFALGEQVFTIYVQRTEDNIPNTWDASWETGTNVTTVWGYNG